LAREGDGDWARLWQEREGVRADRLVRSRVEIVSRRRAEAYAEPLPHLGKRVLVNRRAARHY